VLLDLVLEVFFGQLMGFVQPGCRIELGMSVMMTMMTTATAIRSERVSMGEG